MLDYLTLSSACQKLHLQFMQGGLARMRSTASHHAYSNRPMDRERKQVLAETVQNLDESQIEGDQPSQNLVKQEPVVL